MAYGSSCLYPQSSEIAPYLAYNFGCWDIILKIINTKEEFAFAFHSHWFYCFGSVVMIGIAKGRA